MPTQVENTTLEAQPNVFGYEGSFTFTPKFWSLVVLTGVGAGIAAGLLMMLLRAAEHVAWSYSSGDFLDAVSKSTATRRIVVLLCAGLLVAAARRIFRRHTGGHAGEVAAAIWFRSGEVPFWNTIGRAIVSVLAVGLGAAVGRESAPKQAGAAISSVLAKFAEIPPSQRRLLVACGTGAGMAAVYNVPVGGALFALEVLLGHLSLSLVLPALATSIIAVTTSWTLLPNEVTYTFPAYPFTWTALGGGVLLGLCAGIASVFYIKALAWADRRKPKGKWVVIAPMLVYAALGVAAIAYPQLLGNGKDVVQLAFVDQMALPLLAALLIPRTLATIACLGSGTPGGLFTPTLTVGALLGGLFGHLWNLFFPGEAIAAYAIFGAGAFLAACFKGPISALVLVFELTNHVTSLAAPLILASAIATVVSKHFDTRSIYSARIHLGKAEATELKQPQVVSAAMPYPEVLKRFLSFGKDHAPLYVVDEAGALVGQISPERATKAEDVRPFESACADDLATPARALPSSLSTAEMADRIAKQHVPELPIMEVASGRLLGVFDAQRGRIDFRG